MSDDHSIFGVKEVNVEVSDYDDAVLLLRSCGLEAKTRQETKREIWRFGEVEICIDTWPWLPTFIEIEGPSEDLVWEMAVRLGFNKEQAKFGSVDVTYSQYYGISPEVINLYTPEISFGMKPPEWVKRKLK